MKHTKVYILILLLFSGSAFAGADIFEDIGLAIRSGNSKEIGKYFNSSVDLTIMNQDDVYSRAQAEVILRDFLGKNTPKAFSIIHQGTSKEGARYAIGSLQTSQGASFRTYIFVKQVGGQFLIHELRFEKE